SPDFGFERFALDQLHHVEAFTVLFPVVTNARDVRMTDLRSGPRFSQKTRSRAGILCDLSVDDFQRDDGIQNRITPAISYRHGAGTEFDRKTVRADFHFEVIVFQWPWD